MKAPRFGLLLALLLHSTFAHAVDFGISEIYAFFVAYGAYVVVAVEIAYSAYAQSEAKRKAKNASNDSLTDRTITSRSATEPRRMVLGRQRVGGVVAFIASTGPNKEHLVMVIALAAHECDGIEQIYFNNNPVTLDGGIGEYVTTSPYSSGNLTSYKENFTGDGTMVTFTVANTPANNTVSAAQDTGSGSDLSTTPIGVAGVSGTTVTLSTAPTGNFYISYQATVATNYARVRTFLGGVGQTVDSVVQGLFPDAWNANHPMSGCAGLAVFFDYNETAFTTEVQVSAVMRGAKCYDPRLDSTAGGSGPQRVADPTTWTWSENPAVLIGYAAMSPLCGRQPASAIRWDDLAAAANVCDTQVDYSTWGQLTDESGDGLTDETGEQLLI